MLAFEQFCRLKNLYINRPLYNVSEVREWAERVGFTDFVPDPHVSVAFSRKLVDWDAIPEHGEPLTSIGGRRWVSQLGEQGAYVLHFEDVVLADQHHEIRRAGAGWDFRDYKPHVTLTYTDPKMDLTRLAPYEGRLMFGAEIRAPLEA